MVDMIGVELKGVKRDEGGNEDGYPWHLTYPIQNFTFTYIRQFIWNMKIPFAWLTLT